MDLRTSDLILSVTEAGGRKLIAAARITAIRPRADLTIIEIAGLLPMPPFLITWTGDLIEFSDNLVTWRG